MAYQWNLNGTNIAGATNSILLLAAVQWSNHGNYSVVLTNIAGAATSAVAKLTVYIPPSITTQPQSQTLSIGQSAAFTVAARGTATLRYQWNFNGTALPGATNAVLMLTSLHAANAGSYTVVVTNIAGLATSAAANLTVTNPVIVLSNATGSSLAASGFTFQVSVPAGATYVILTSTDCVNWTPIATNVAVTGNEIFTDASATNSRSQFYRALAW